MIQLGMTIKRLRLERKLSQKALAEGANLTPSFVSLIENGHRIPSVAVIGRMASALGLPEEVLIWDAVELPRNLNEDDRRLCEMAKLIVRRFYETLNDDPPRQEIEVPSTHRDAG